jgi:hypothetical protein
MLKVNIMKRNFLMKAFVCLFTVVALCSCNKDEDDEDGNGTVPDNAVTVVENGTSYNGKIDTVKLKAGIYSGDTWSDVTLASGIYENGGFKIDFPASVNAQYLEDFDEDDVPQGLTLSNPNAKFSFLSLDAYKSNSQIGYFYHGTGDWEGYPAYSDSDFNLTGSYTETDEYEGVTYTDKSTYNVHVKKGWNMVYEKETEKGDNSYEYEMTTSVPSGAKWYFYGYSSEQSSVSGSLLKPKTLSAKRTFGLK